MRSWSAPCLLPLLRHAVCVWLALPLVTVAQVGQPYAAPPPVDAVAPPPLIPPATAAAADPGSAARRALNMTGGRVLDVQTDVDGGRSRYMVKILTGDGRVKVVPIDGATAHGFAD